MTTLIAVRQDQDWVGFAVVGGILLALSLVAYVEIRLAPSCDSPEDLAALAALEADHVDCANPDCDLTICACRQPHECTGCTTVGCDHPNRFGGLLCWACRFACGVCVAEVAAESDLDWAAGR
jgi:hypothetical protein